MPENSIGYTSGNWISLNTPILPIPSSENSYADDSYVNNSYVNDSGGNEIYTVPRKFQTAAPVPAVLILPLTVKDGTASGSADDTLTAGALDEAKKEARAAKDGIAVQYDGKTTEAYNSFSITLSRETLNRLTDPGNYVKQLTISMTAISLTFDSEALKELAARSSGAVTLTASKEAELTKAALDAVGSRPAYRLSVEYTGEDGRTATVSEFGTGSLTAGIAYTPAVNEQTSGLRLIRSRDDGSVEWLDGSGYEAKSGRVTGSIGHLSVYGVGCKPGVDGR